MSQRMVTDCDRCRAEIRNPPESLHLRMGHGFGVESGDTVEDLDLCHSCMRAMLFDLICVSKMNEEERADFLAAARKKPPMIHVRA